MFPRRSSTFPDRFLDGGRSVAALSAAVAITLAVIVCVVGWIVHARRSAATAPVVSVTAEESAYLTHISVTGARMSVAQNFLGDAVYYLNGEVTNTGSKTVRTLDLQLEFVDPFNQVVLRDTVHPVTRSLSPLKPGETRPFRMTYEHISAEWNQGPPRITPVSVGF